MPDAIVNTRGAVGLDNTRGAVGPDETPAALERLLAHEPLRALCTRLLGAPYERVHASLPRKLGAEQAAHAFRGPATLLSLGGVPFADAGLSVVVGHPGAHTLVERILGGTQRVASAEPPGSGECGVLAYGVARVLAALESPLVLGDARPASREQLREAGVGQVLWPLVLESSLDTLELGVLLSPAAARAWPWPFRLRLSLFDELEPGAPLELEAGEVLVSDSLSLISASDGLHGAATLRVDGLVDQARATLTGGQAHATGESVRASGAALELCLATRLVNLVELSEVLAGAAPAFSAVDYDAVELRQAGRTVASGQLGTLRGALCVRINRRESAA